MTEREREMVEMQLEKIRLLREKALIPELKKKIRLLEEQLEQCRQVSRDLLVQLAISRGQE